MCIKNCDDDGGGFLTRDFIIIVFMFLLFNSYLFGPLYDLYDLFFTAIYRAKK